MSATLAALLPVILVIASGYLIAKTGLITDEQWRGVERLAYLVLFPAVLFQTIRQADFTSFPTLGMGGALLATLVVMAAVLLSLRPVLERVFGIAAYRFTSIFQGTLRWNAMIALAIANNFAGETGLALLAIAMVFLIPVVNIMSVVVLSRFAAGSAPSGSRILKDLYTNPFILSIGAGVVFNLSGLPLPAVFTDMLEIFARAALPIGIICVGAGLDLGSLRKPGPALTLGTFLRPVFMPLVAFGFATLFGIEGTVLAVVIIASSVPCASNSYLLARQMGGDAKLMAEIVTLQTLSATVTIPLTLLVFT